MMMIFVRLCISALALLLAAYLIPGIHVASFYTALIVALVLGILNIFVRPLLVLLTLPITLVTFGLFVFVINAAIFWFVASFVEGFSVSGFFPALMGSLLISVVSAAANKLLE